MACAQEGVATVHIIIILFFFNLSKMFFKCLDGVLNILIISLVYQCCFGLKKYGSIQLLINRIENYDSVCSISADLSVILL